jgi:four helix bundle protein
MSSRNYRDLIVWQRAMDYVTECDRTTSRFPRDERFGLSAQLQRAAVSVPSNIAEGHGRGHLKAFANHLWIANGSLRESETQLIIAERLGYVAPESLRPLLDLANEVGRLITGLRRSLERRRPDIPPSPRELPPEPPPA